ncbi:MAG: hypothetical protein AMXMBFR8_15230 [Nevskiales bacterium]
MIEFQYVENDSRSLIAPGRGAMRADDARRSQGTLSPADKIGNGDWPRIHVRPRSGLSCRPDPICPVYNAPPD